MNLYLVHGPPKSDFLQFDRRD